MERSTKHGSENDIRNFTYDPDGNMTSDGRGIYKYDGLNRMTEAAMEDGRKLICRYDAEGLRHETEENGRLVSSDSENARTYYHYACDSLGSITHVIAGDEFGNVETNGDINDRILCRYDYDAFGNTINAEETITNRYGFTGEMHDDITEMYYLRARYYAPYMGRFTQADTYHGDGLNLYVYAGNNPVKYVDPSGHSYKNNGLESGSSFTNLYRVMSEAEYDSVMSNGKFVPYDRAMEEKWFATTQDDATKWANIFYPDGDYRMVEVTVNTNSLQEMYYNQHLDNIGPAYCSSLEVLEKAIKSIKGVKQ